MRADRLALVIALALAPALAPGARAAGPRVPAGDPGVAPGAGLGEEPHAERPGPARSSGHGRAGDRPRAVASASASASAPASASASGPVTRVAAAAPRPQDLLARQLADEAAAVERALAAVTDKLAAAELARGNRLRAAVRAIHGSPGEDAMAIARRRAAAGLLLARDGGERALLVDEDARLRAARARIAGDTVQLPSIAFPGELARPAPGPIARQFGTLEHERSRATLARRGIDLEVADHSPVTAPAAGTVRYAGPIRGLDQGVILDHGAYLTVIAKLAEVALPVGAPLAAGDRIGRAARHRVYLEVRVKLGPGGLPIDPEPLLGKPR